MRCVATFISNGRNSNEKRMEQLRAAVEELKAVTDSETEDYQQRQVESTTTDTCRQGMPVERFEPSTLAGLVFETSAYTVPPHRLVEPIERITSTEKKPTTSEIHAKQDVQKAYHRVEPTSIGRYYPTRAIGAPRSRMLTCGKKPYIIDEHNG